MVLIVVLFILLGGLAGGGYAVWWLYFPGYRGESLIECISDIPEAQLTMEQQRLAREDYEAFVMTQAMLLKSPGILGEALKVTAVRETDWYKSVRPDEHLLELIEELSAAPVRGTNFLRVSIECYNPKDPAIIVNEVVNQWLHAVRKRSAEEVTTQPLSAALQEQEAFQREIAEGRRRLEAIALRLPAGARQNPGGNVSNQQVQQFAEQAAILQLELSQLEQYRGIYNDPEGLAATAEDRSLVEQDPQVAELAQFLFRLEQQRAADEMVYGSEHSVYKQIDAQVRAAEAQLAQLRMERLQERRADIRETVNTAYENTRHALFLAQENLAKAEAALQDQDQLLFQYSNLETEMTQKVEYGLQLDGYIKSLSRVKAQRSAINVNVAQPAIDPLERSSPNIVLLPVGIFLALVLSLGIALGLEALDTSVRTTQDIARHVDVAMLGAIPDTDDEEVAIRRVETAVRDAPRSMVAEAFRRVRTNLQFSAPADRQRSVVVTGPRPGDGKTTVACNLAMAVAQGGRRVLLVDANFRRPSIHRVFENIPARGLSNLLIGEGSLPDYVVRTNVPMLDVLGSGPTPPNPAELLGGEPCRALLREAAAKYDQVIIDTAPVLLASDALVLSTAVDGVILVVRANENTRGVVRRACGLLGDVGAHLFGAVLNAARVRRGGYFREQFRAYYDYQTETAADAGVGSSPGKESDSSASGE
jgi:capsular exopolysaccharide synthesis family protein